VRYEIIAIRENPTYTERAVSYFSERWGIDEKLYLDCMMNSLNTPSNLPRFYLMLEGERIIGGYGLVTNDFVSRQDLFPYLCALYIEEDKRGHGLGSTLLNHGRSEAHRLGYDKLYLCTDLEGFYEKNGWRFIGDGYHPWNHVSKIYEASTRGRE